MPRVKKIQRNPAGKNYFLVDTNFLVNRYLKSSYYDRIPNLRNKLEKEKYRVEKSLNWWREIDDQLKRGKARLYIPDFCIAEAFKVLADKYYRDHVFKTANEFNNAKKRLSKDVTTSARTLRAYRRNIKCHDVSTCRDIIISVDRFFEMFMKKGKNVQIADLMVIATAKYLMDFYDIPKDSLYLITLDDELWSGTKLLVDLPKPFNPKEQSCDVSRVFE